MFCITNSVNKCQNINTAQSTSNVRMNNHEVKKESSQRTDRFRPSGGDEQVPPFPPRACRLGLAETEISQMKLMRTSGGGSTYSPSRLSSLWLLVHSDTLPCLWETVLFLQPPKCVQRWLNTPKWPYQLFYYFSCAGEGVGETHFQLGDLVRIPPAYPPCQEFGAQWLCRTFISDSKERERGTLWSCFWSYLDFKVVLLYPYASFVLYHSRLVSSAPSILNVLPDCAQYRMIEIIQMCTQAVLLLKIKKCCVCACGFQNHHISDPPLWLWKVRTKQTVNLRGWEMKPMLKNADHPTANQSP